MARATQISLGVVPAGRRPAPTPRKPCQVCGKRNCTCIEDALAGQMRMAGFPEPVREFPFARSIGRSWRADFGWPFIRLIVECEGGIWSAGAHVRGAGYSEDMEKYNQAALMGYMVLRFTKEMVEDGRALAVIERGMKRRGVRWADGGARYTMKYPVK
jgi:very-short-patch-repair endonuclease